MSLKRKAAEAATDLAKKPKVNASITSFFGAPKPVTSASSAGAGTTSNTTTPTSSAKNISSSPATAIPAPIFASSATSTLSSSSTSFDKDKWVASLNPDQKALLALEIGTMDESWLAVLKSELVSEEFLSLKRFLKKEVESGKKVFPPSSDVYSWSRHTPLHKVKAVILGQDPYHNVNQAHGLCFSVRPPTPAPPSLKNMYTALKKDYPNFSPPPNKGGLLTPWADRGVLLLNTCLTVRAHEANSHAGKGWERLTQKVIDTVAAKRTKGVVFLAWGSPAQKRCAKIDKKKHLVLTSVHPSPLSAHKGFFECGHFKKANDWLSQRYGVEEVIDWNLDVDPEVAGV